MKNVKDNQNIQTDLYATVLFSSAYLHQSMRKEGKMRYELLCYLNKRHNGIMVVAYASFLLQNKKASITLPFLGRAPL